MTHDWHQIRDEPEEAGPDADPRSRMRWCFGLFVAGLIAVFLRVAHLEATQGTAYRNEMLQPIARRQSIPGIRGRILSHDGTVLACDEKVLALAVHYRWMEEPPHPGWLRSQVRKRLRPAERRDPARVEAEQAAFLKERDALARRLAELSGVPWRQWQARMRQCQARVERIARSVARRADTPPSPAESGAKSAAEPADWTESLGQWAQGVLDDAETPGPIVVAEELDYHPLAEDLPLAAVAEIQAYPERYPGVRIVARSRRSYPGGTLAATVLGYLGTAPQAAETVSSGTADEEPPGDALVGLAGLEKQYDTVLRGESGVAVELSDRGGQLLTSYVEERAGAGRDLVLTLDARLQQTAERLLDEALARRAITAGGVLPAEPGGGAVVVLDVHSGAVRAAASAPRFDPRLFGTGSPETARLLADPNSPLVDRTSQMAIAPGSVFKTVTAVALLESGTITPDTRFECRGYLDDRDHLRCQVFRRYGVGHGEMDLADALGQSCNVFFFHHARVMGAGPLVAWAWDLGFGQPTGIDLPGEASGVLPAADAPGELLLTSVGQGAVTVTPLQAARFMAAVANGGRLVHPHLAADVALETSPAGEETAGTAGGSAFSATQVPGLHEETLAAVEAGLLRTVSDPRGTAYRTLRITGIPVAGKTGTAETGGDRPDHAWFAGYAPADRPRVAFVVALQYAGDASVAAAPVARRLVERMRDIGLLR